MDPDTTLAWIRDCLAAGNREAAKESGYDLADWILRGGFTPADPSWADTLHELGYVGDYGPTRPVPGREAKSEAGYFEPSLAHLPDGTPRAVQRDPEPSHDMEQEMGQ
jgi:hypothetical protein